MDEDGGVEERTWLAMDLLAPVLDLRALEESPRVEGHAPEAVQALARGILGDHRPELTDAATSGLLDLERVLVLGATLDAAAGLVEPEQLSLVECLLVDEACRLPLMPLVNAAADLLLELRRDADAGGADALDVLHGVGAGDLRARSPELGSPDRPSLAAARVSVRGERHGASRRAAPCATLPARGPPPAAFTRFGGRPGSRVSSRRAGGGGRAAPRGCQGPRSQSSR